MNKKSSLDMEKIIPTDPKLGGKKKRKSAQKSTKKPKNPVDPTKPINAQPLKYNTAVDPFKDASAMVKFFQKGLRSFDAKAIMPKIGSETTSAGVILDKMSDGGRKEDREFLLSWMRWHFEYNLKGKKTYNIKHTCIKKFGDTFTDYSSGYQSIKDKMSLIPE